MTRRPPDILSVVPTSEGAIAVTWQVDAFFADSEPPEKVLIDLNGSPFSELDGDEESIEIPQTTIATLGATTIGITVSFWWSGSPPEEQRSSVSIPISTGGAGAGSSGVYPAAKPIVSVAGVWPRTLQAANRIAIKWQSNNYNDGNIVWGPELTPVAFRHSIRPRGENYQGTFTTNQPLVPSTNYVVKVEVRNTLHSPTWISTTLMIRSAANYRSLRQFLHASEAAIPASMRAYFPHGGSIRSLLNG